jgi:hypothetical protein
MPPEILLAILGFAALFALMLVLGHQAERRRREAFSALAHSEGLAYEPEKHPPQLPFELFDRGHSRYAQHRLHGQLKDAIAGLGDVPWHCFGYHYAITSGSGKNRRTQHYHFRCILIDTGIDLGRVSLAPEGLGARLAHLFGRQDIDLDDMDFSRRVEVQSDSPAQAYALLGRELMQWWPRSGDWHLEAEGPKCLLYQPGGWQADEYFALKRFSEEFLDRLPRPLVNDERIRRGMPASLQAGVAALRPEAGAGQD